MSLVPSQISSSFASRNHFCGGRVADVAGSASVFAAAEVANTAASDAASLAIAASVRERLPRVRELGSVQGHEARLVELQLRVGEPERDGLELVDRPAERLALLRVVDRELECRPPEPDRPGRELDAGDVEHPHQSAEAVAFGAEPAVLGHEAVLELDLGRGEAAAAHLGQAGPAHEASSPRSTTNAVIPRERLPGSTVAKRSRRRRSPRCR